MPGDRTNPTPEEVRASWEQFRDATFMFIDDAADCTVWVWTSPLEFDFVMAGLHLREVADVKVAIGPGALAITVYGSLHMVPLWNIKATSTEAMQPNVTFDLTARQAELGVVQRQAVARLEQFVRERFSVKVPPPSDHGRHTH